MYSYEYFNKISEILSEHGEMSFQRVARLLQGDWTDIQYYCKKYPKIFKTNRLNHDVDLAPGWENALLSLHRSSIIIRAKEKFRHDSMRAVHSEFDLLERWMKLAKGDTREQHMLEYLREKALSHIVWPRLMR